MNCPVCSMPCSFRSNQWICYCQTDLTFIGNPREPEGFELDTFYLYLWLPNQARLTFVGLSASWVLTASSGDTHSSIMRGHEPISPQQAWQKLLKVEKLLVFL